MWRDVWITNDAKGGERHERGVSRPSRPFVNFVVQIDALVYESYGLGEEEIEIVPILLANQFVSGQIR